MYNTGAFNLTADELADRLRGEGFERVADKIRELILPAINFHPEIRADDDIVLGVSKIGGRADLGPGIEWPSTSDGWPMAFLAQINLAHVADYDVRHELAPNGLLSFFYDAQRAPYGFDPADRGKWEVLYQPAVSELCRAGFPQPLPPECRFGSADIHFRSLWTLPSVEDLSLTTFKFTKDEDLKYEELLFGTLPGADQESAALLGHPTIIQCELQRQCQMASNGVYWGDPDAVRDPRVPGLEGGAAQWRLLFQLPSLVRLGMYWGGTGYVYFMIRDTDLANWDFGKVWLVLQGT